MKRKLQIIVSTSASWVLAFSALAQDESKPKTDALGTSQNPIPLSAWANRLNDTAKASEIMGMTVKNNQHEKLGEVENLAVNVESGRIVLVIISSGGFLSMNKALTPVPLGALHHVVGQKILLLDASTEKFHAAPKCETAKWEEELQSKRVSDVYGYYGQVPYFTLEGYATTTKDAVLNNILPRNIDVSINSDGSRPAEIGFHVQKARNGEEQNNNVATLNPEVASIQTHDSSEGGAKSSWSNLGYVQKATKLIGTSVNNLMDEKLGKLKDFIVDLPASRIVAVIISSSEYTGLDGELVAVPPTTLKFNPEQTSLLLDTTKQSLASSQHFKSNQWPDFNQTGYVGGIYHAYHVEPYFYTDAYTQSDNTSRNDRNRVGSTLGQLDQGNSEADMDTTAHIRKEIIANDRMSMNAQNVKVFTMNGRVTLRGLVNTADEKRQIGDIAYRIAQSSNVNNQLEVMQTTTSSLN